MMILIFIAFVLDRLSKVLAVQFLQNHDIALLPGLNFTLALNRGISFGMLNFSSQALFWVVTSSIIVILGIFCRYMIKEFYAGNNITAELFILVGGLSNIVDRFVYGGVIDFIDLHLWDYHWYIFNLADAYIVVGVAVIFLRGVYVFSREG